MKAKLQKEKKKFHIEISFSYSKERVEFVKSLEGRRYNPETKSWKCTMSLTSVEKLKDNGWELCTRLSKYIERKRFKRDIKNMGDFKLPKLNGSLMLFQKHGVYLMEKQDGHVLLADEMGLGKTIQTIAWMELRKELKPILIIVPASLKRLWQKEIRKWTGRKAQVLSGKKPRPILRRDIIIINYDIVHEWRVLLRAYGFKLMVLDECHMIMTSGAKRTKATRLIGRDVSRIIAISGTPLINKPREIYNAVHLVDSTLFPNKRDFQKTYCGAKHTGFGWDYNGASNTKELHSILSSTIMIRRLKKDVLQELPDKTYSFIPLDITNRSEYNRAKNDFLSYIGEKKGREAAEKAESAERLVQIGQLRHLAAEGKTNMVIQWINGFLHSGKKLVVMGIHKAILRKVMGSFLDVSVKIDGSTGTKAREKAVEEFQNNPSIKIFFGNIKAAGVGITLTASSDIMILEYPWTPGELNQVIDRVHRITQTEKVQVHYPYGVNTIEQYLVEILDKKMKILNSVLDGSDIENVSVFHELLEKMKSS